MKSLLMPPKSNSNTRSPALTDPPPGAGDHPPRANPCDGNHRWLRRDGLICIVKVVAASVGMMVCLGCQATPTGLPPEQLAVQTPVVLSPGDVVRVSFPGAAELTQTQKIRMDGKINLPLVGEVAAAGKTLDKLQGELIRLYTPQLQNNSVVVTVEAGDIRVFVSGAVKTPGKMMFDRPTTVLEALVGAGGINAVGNLKKVRLIRVVQGEHQTQVLDLRTALNGRATHASYVRSGDVIYVPENIF